tara:strand:+ start:1955 stop:2791 length:837 start_codon:yes stop_codon:yes gene_type:complete
MMSDQTTVDSPEIDNPETATENAENVSTATATKEASAPKVEVKDGKTFVDGIRVYSRDETNKIAANAKAQVEKNVLNELDVDSFDQVKTVISELRSVNTNQEQPSLDVQSLRDAVKKKEQSLDELQNTVTALKTELVMKDHMSNLQNAMPTEWAGEQRAAVIDLMKARGMMQIQDETFVIKDGDNFLTTDGDTPDYRTAVESIGKTIGLPFAKKGIDAVSTDSGQAVDKSTRKSVDESRLKSDNKYRSAWVGYRNANPSLGMAQVTHKAVLDHMNKNK